MGLTDRLKSFDQEETVEQAANAEKARRTTAEQQAQATVIEQESLAQRQATGARIVNHLSPLLKVLEAQKNLKELRNYWGIGNVDRNPIPIIGQHDVPESIELGLRISWWDREAIIEKYTDPYEYGERHKIAGYKVVKVASGLFLTARREPELAFRIHNHWGGFHNTVRSPWIPFLAEDSRLASDLLEDTLFEYTKKIKHPVDVIKEASARVRQDITWPPFSFLFQIK